MVLLGGFDPNVGIARVLDSASEIGRANLPGASRFIPESTPIDAPRAMVYGQVSPSAIADALSAYLRPDLRHRELQSPDVLFQVLEEAARDWAREAEERGDGEGGAMGEAARALLEILSDRQLCEMLRHLVLKA